MRFMKVSMGNKDGFINLDKVTAITPKEDGKVGVYVFVEDSSAPFYVTNSFDCIEEALKIASEME